MEFKWEWCNRCASAVVIIYFICMTIIMFILTQAIINKILSADIWIWALFWMLVFHPSVNTGKASDLENYKIDDKE